ncbi:MAG: hypothetical protein JST80_08640 [Bdellovibrionales bacterium]|nr:hypothetical protein [Bdellovibrionales bacterium]
MGKKVVIAVPVYKALFSKDDLLSLGLLQEVLKDYEIKIFKPKSLNVQVNDWEAVSVPDQMMSSRASYSEMLLSKDFYEAFFPADKILIHQLDALVVQNTLSQWVDADLDYIGPIWVRSSIEKWENVTWDYVDEGVGNGGFSLRDLRGSIKALQIAEDQAHQKFAGLSELSGGALVREFTRRYLDSKVFADNEDMFWGLVAENIDKSYKKGSIQQSLEFGFEYDPEYCLRRLGKAPFGCHAWNRFPETRKFWLDFLKERFDVEALKKKIKIK